MRISINLQTSQLAIHLHYQTDILNWYFFFLAFNDRRAVIDQIEFKYYSKTCWLTLASN